MLNQNLLPTSKDSGFTVIELMFAVLILSFGLTGILHSFITTLTSMQRTQNIELVSALTEEKMEEIKRETAENQGIAPGRTSGQSHIAEGKTFDWELVVIPSGVADTLNEVRLVFSWPEHNTTQKFITVTYLKNIETKK
jgi:prepilin-type N-terminal cleavage/methylation domain-containing protein